MLISADVFFKALACDFDGTLAFEDRIGPSVRDALERARKAGLRLILVTGRTFFELTRVCDCLEVFCTISPRCRSLPTAWTAPTCRSPSAGTSPSSGATCC